MKKLNYSLENLLALDGERIVIDEQLGLWVKFEVKRVDCTLERPHGIRYSLTLHDRSNKRIMGFDNAHAIEYGGKRNVPSKRTHDHWHRTKSDKGHPYQYIDAEQLIKDFWSEVDKIVRGANK